MCEKLVSRERLLQRMRPAYDADIIKVIVGPMRSGKSTVLSMIADEIEADEDHKIRIDFSDARNKDLRDSVVLNSHVTDLMKAGRYYLFFDEVQYVKDCPRVLASLMSTRMCSIFVTGSSQRLGEDESCLVGRTMSFDLLPFSYSEAKECMSAATGSVPEDFLSNYIRFGGYPQRFQADGKDDARVLLEKLYERILMKGILSGQLDLNIDKFGKVAAYVMANCGRNPSAESILQYIMEADGIKISIQTVYNYLDIMEEACLLKRVGTYNIRKKTVLSNLPTNYAIDNGLGCAMAGTADPQIGSALKNLVYLELLGRGYEVYVGKNGDEKVDFVAMMGGRKCFIQAAYIMADDAALKREFGPLLSVRDHSPKYVISMDPIDMSRDGITHLNLTDFLEGRKDLFLS